jgi:23S rRNA (guanosine2251-2'-O)-methyltransferase
VSPELELADDEELIAGRRPVEEAFAARREAIRLLVVPERRQALDALVIHATTLRIPVVELEGGSLTSLAGFDGHQGIALVAKPRATADIETILAGAKKRGESPFVLVLDSLEDPQNFGTMLRSAEAVGVHGVFYPTRRAAPLSPSAIKAAAGATEHLALAPVEDLPGTLADLHARGVRIVAAEEDAALSYAEADLRGPLAIVIGSEGQGISAVVRKRIDHSVRIPMRGRIGSLNAAVAGSILLFAAAQQRPMPAQPLEAPTEPFEPSLEPIASEEPVAERPKRTRAKKAGAPAPEPVAEKPKRTRAKKAESPAPEPVADKPKRTRAKKAEAPSPEPVADKPKRTRAKKAAAEATATEDLLPTD